MSCDSRRLCVSHRIVMIQNGLSTGIVEFVTDQACWRLVLYHIGTNHQQQQQQQQLNRNGNVIYSLLYDIIIIIIISVFNELDSHTYTE